MTLRLHTARVSYGGPDRIDVTRKSGGPVGLPFAPSWPLLSWGLGEIRAGRLVEAWPVYRDRYVEEMRRSYRDHHEDWRDMLRRDEVTMVCYCRDAAYCHRSVLAGLFAKMGANYAGERR